jgi:hypothetical protein
MIVITDRVGQCIKLKPQTGEIIVNGYNLKRPSPEPRHAR